jgi:hypothetical protein
VSVEARAYVGLLDALKGNVSAGRQAVESCVDHASQMGRKPLEVRCRVFMAQIDVASARFDAALATLNGIPEDTGDFTIGPELRAHAHYWRQRALAGRGDSAAASQEQQAARRLIEALRETIPEKFRAAFDARQEIRQIVG